VISGGGDVGGSDNPELQRYRAGLWLSARGGGVGIFNRIAATRRAKRCELFFGSATGARGTRLSDLATGRVIAAALVRLTAVDARIFRNFG
jgi:hypothetical protein